ncbi:TetR/AcrR family transcriptional regulator [Moorena producens JHB]|uniref:TetR/AcrR family transcriptional regulator n=1 Tax=Moorena producens (strain JHB) TaxID=1454205 RepID=A0A1D9FWB8_MOOP1|nr:TetR/AcrR family transcriptional regulator [Moorena producens]AOY79641.1 TetR/AcrR family transcriptional regulator [Moorena producens JHB]
MVGRKLEFDREEALEKAMDLFWSKGYNATGLNDLLKHMGIQRQSLYNTFGSKHALFLEAVQHYGQTVVCCIEQRLNEPGSPLENIRNLIRGLASEAICPKYRGCMMANTMMELAPHDPAVAKMVQCLTRQVDKALERALERAVAAQELPREANPRQLARFLHHVILGFNVRGKIHPSCSYLDDILEVALSVLE